VVKTTHCGYGGGQDNRPYSEPQLSVAGASSSEVGRHGQGASTGLITATQHIDWEASCLSPKHLASSVISKSQWLKMHFSGVEVAIGEKIASGNGTSTQVYMKLSAEAGSQI